MSKESEINDSSSTKNNLKMKKSEYENCLMNEIVRTAEMSLNAFDEIIDQIVNSEFRDYLKNVRARYVLLEDRTKAIMNTKEYTIKKFDKISKFMQKSAIVMNLMKENSDSYIAEMLLKGTNMGVISVSRCLNEQKEAISEEGISMADSCVKLLSESSENYKKYL